MTEPQNFLERSWRLLLVRGIAVILFGIAASAWFWAVLIGAVLIAVAFWLRRVARNLAACMPAR